MRSFIRGCGALLVTVGLLSCPAQALRAADVYKSVDAQGHVVYSDQAEPASTQQSPVEMTGSDQAADAEVRAVQAPPELPQSEQPPCPDEGYLWAPGYWAWDGSGYYWVPGVWVQPPRAGVLWTPGYWAYIDSLYIFHRGYWAAHVGFYGGINYGFGYFGVGYAGGRWIGQSFAYNEAVSNLDGHAFHHIYRESISEAAIHNRVSYNNGPGGTNASPTAQERAFAAAEPHYPATSAQRHNLTQVARSLSPTQTLVRIEPPPPASTHPSGVTRTKAAAPSAPIAAIARSTAATTASSHVSVPPKVAAPLQPVAPRTVVPPRVTPTRITAHPIQH